MNKIQGIGLKTLHLFRHAKAAAGDADMRDVDRPLTPEGAATAAQLSRHLRKAGIAPAVILCSPSARTAATCHAFTTEEAADTQVRVSERLYLASPGELLHHIHALEDKFPSAMIIGHNPGLQLLCLQLCKDGADGFIDDVTLKFPTAACASIVFKTTRWRDIAPDSGHLAGVVFPKRLFAQAGE